MFPYFPIKSQMFQPAIFCFAQAILQALEDEGPTGRLEKWGGLRGLSFDPLRVSDISVEWLTYQYYQYYQSYCGYLDPAISLLQQSNMMESPYENPHLLN